MAALDFFDPRTARFPYNRFMEFIAPQADRYSIISSILDEARLNSLVLPIAGNRHFLILPPGENIHAGELPFRGRNPVVLTAHYDRFPGSSGANDNSAAVFQLIVTAQKLVSGNLSFWMIFLTDKEELGEGEGIEDQGAYSLASTLRDGGLADARVYVFDACGTGDTIIISTAADTLLKNEERAPFRKLRELIQGLRVHALESARDLRLDRVLLLPTPLSDDAGFLRAGLPAQTITVLPREEASLFTEFLRIHPEFAASLIRRSIHEKSGDQRERRFFPETWRSLNSPADSHLRLTPREYPLIIRFAQALCED
ncbi:MAG: M28 family peptidase [Treponema sp.]|jgi:hypothetical protein|nr:M28 family peptidase [Treponema sp.]